MSHHFMLNRPLLYSVFTSLIVARPLAWAALLAIGLFGLLHSVLAAAPLDPMPHLPCGEPSDDEPYHLAGFHLYFADEFNCDALGPHWSQQEMMTPASYVPPQSGYVTVGDGRLAVGVHEQERSFPYLSLVDDAATTYDVPHTDRRVDWLPDVNSRMRIDIRMRFQIDQPGDHRVSIYADGHTPGYGGPLFYVGSDYNQEWEEWRGLVLGADGGVDVVNLEERGFATPYTDWFVFTVDYLPDEDSMALSVDDTVYLMRSLSEFRDAGRAAVFPDVLYIGSLARLEKPTSWIDLEIDWIRVYVPDTLAPPTTGHLTATVEMPPVPRDAPTSYSLQLPPGPFANTPHWSEEFDDSNGAMPSYWHLLVNHDPKNSTTVVQDRHATLLSNDRAIGVPVWGIVDDILPPRQVLSQADWSIYLRQRNEQTAVLDLSQERIYQYPRMDWRPNRGNVRYAWKALQTADGYGVEVSNGGHFPYFTGALFYTLLDTTANGGQGQFIFPGCQEKYFWELQRLPEFSARVDQETIVTADYINGTVFLYVNGIQIGWWPESDCSLNWYLQGPNAVSPDLLFFGNPAQEDPGSWSEVFVDWFATFPEVTQEARPHVLDLTMPEFHLYMDDKTDPFIATLQLQTTTEFSSSIRWQARFSSVPTWLTIDRSQGVLSVPMSGTVVLPPPADSLLLSVRRPLTHGTHITILTVEGWTADEQAVQPVQTVIYMHYAARWHQHFLPNLLMQREKIPVFDSRPRERDGRRP